MPLTSHPDWHDRNRNLFNSAEVVSLYEDLDALTPAEESIFRRHLSQGARILDLGVGAGRTVGFLNEIAGSYVGIDYAEQMIDRCRRRYPDGKFHTVDACDMSKFESRSFDAVVFSFNGLDYIHPITARGTALDECRRVLRDEGVFLFSGHNPRAIVVRPGPTSGSAIKRAKRAAHATRRSLEKVQRMCRTGAFWRGAGYFVEPIHGDMIEYGATPRHVVAELEGAGFRLLEIVGANYPASCPQLTTPWYYYAFERVRGWASGGGA
jgi:SAM-dependent methyltransferase